LVLELPPELQKYFGREKAFDTILSLKGKVFREQKNRRTLFFEKDGKGYFVKIHRGVGWKEILKNLFSLRLPIFGVRNEMRAIRRLEDLGVDTLKMVGFGIRGIAPAWLDSFIITEALENTLSLEDFCRTWPSDPPDFSLKLSIVKKVAEIARRLHQNGVNHRDFYICHSLLDLTTLNLKDISQGLRIYIIDLHRVQIRNKTPKRWIIKDLAGLFFSSMDIGLTQRDLFRFMREYRGKTLRDILKEEASFWMAVNKRATKLYKKHFCRLPDIYVRIFQA